MNSGLIRVARSNSRFIFFLKNLFTKYHSFECVFDRIYKESKSYKLIKKFWESLKTGFRYSFLGEITAISERGNSVILSNSRFVSWLLSIYKKWYCRIINFTKSSTVIKSIEQLKKELYLFPVKMVGIILSVAIFVNILLSILLKKEIGLLGWIMRWSFLFIGLGGLFCSANWQYIKQTSFVLKILKK